jgi:DMSO reductase anchor subunit
LGILGIVLTAILPLVWDRQAVLIVFVIVLVAEIIGRWQFYSQRTPFPITVD